jgi:hypothetical protein
MLGLMGESAKESTLMAIHETVDGTGNSLSSGRDRADGQKELETWNMWKDALCVLCLAWPALSWAGPEFATVTILDGGDTSTVLVRDSHRFTLAEGVRLQKSDIVESGATTAQVRLEFSGGTIADLGPDTRVLLAPRLTGDRSKAAPLMYLLQGWVKLTAGKEPGAVPATLACAPLDVYNVADKVVVFLTKSDTYAFAESGRTTLTERADSHPVLLRALDNGQSYSHVPGSEPSVTSRPPATFVQNMPKPFFDTLPARRSVFAARAVPPKPLGKATYADVAAWINAEAALQPMLLAQWRTAAQMPEFRKGLTASTTTLPPEWERVAHPEKFRNKRPAPASAPIYTGIRPSSLASKAP